MKDPMPTWLFKTCIDLLAPYIASLFNLSLSSGIVPTSYNNACVIPCDLVLRSRRCLVDISRVIDQYRICRFFSSYSSPVDRLSVIGWTSSRSSVSLSQVPFDRDCASQGRHRPH